MKPQDSVAHPEKVPAYGYIRPVKLKDDSVKMCSQGRRILFPLFESSQKALMYVL